MINLNTISTGSAVVNTTPQNDVQATAPKPAQRSERTIERRQLLTRRKDRGKNPLMDRRHVPDRRRSNIHFSV